MESYDTNLKDVQKFYQNFNRNMLSYIKNSENAANNIKQISESVGIFTSQNSCPTQFKQPFQTLQTFLVQLQQSNQDLINQLSPLLPQLQFQQIQNSAKASKTAKPPFIQQANTEFVLAAADFEQKNLQKGKEILTTFGIAMTKFASQIIERSSLLLGKGMDIDVAEGKINVSLQFKGLDCGKEIVDILGVRGLQLGSGKQKTKSIPEKKKKREKQVKDSGKTALSPSRQQEQKTVQDDYVQIVPMRQEQFQQTSQVAPVNGQYNNVQQAYQPYNQQQFVQPVQPVQIIQTQPQPQYVTQVQQMPSTVNYSPQYKKKQPQNANYKFADDSVIENDINSEEYPNNIIMLDVPSPNKLKTPEDIQRQLNALAELEKQLLAGQSTGNFNLQQPNQTNGQFIGNQNGCNQLQKQSLYNQQSSFTQDHQNVSISGADPVFYQQQLSAIQAQNATIPSIQSNSHVPSQLIVSQQQQSQQQQQLLQQQQQLQLQQQLAELQQKINQQQIEQPKLVEQSDSLQKNQVIENQNKQQQEDKPKVQEKSESEPSKTSNSSSKKGFFKPAEPKKEIKKFNLYGDDEEEEEKPKKVEKKSTLPQIDIDIPELESQASNLNKKVNLDAFF